MQITLQVHKSLEENAGTYFDKSKKAKSKLEGAREALADSERKLKKLEKQAAKEQVEEEKKVKAPRKWYHKFRWFKTSDGFLAIGGRDATTNDIIVKKHAEEGDLVYHTERPGSPFFILKARAEGFETLSGEFPDQSKLEVAQACATFSKAWARELGSDEVYYVKPDQLKKELGLPKGTFMVYGKRQFYDAVLDLCVGYMDNAEIITGPKKAVEKWSVGYVILERGNRKASDIGKQFLKEFGGDLDAIIRSLPGGTFKVVQVVKP